MDESSFQSRTVPPVMATAAAPVSSSIPLRNAELLDLVGQIALGRHSALGSMYDETSPLVFGLAVRMLGDRADAEEITADVYSQVWRTAATFDSTRGSVTTWLVMLTRSRAIDRLRTRTERWKREQAIDDQAEAADPGPAPDEASVQSEQRRMVQAALAELVPEQRRLIELAFFSGLSHSELAERTGLPLGTVKTRIRLGMLKLRERLGALEGR